MFFYDYVKPNLNPVSQFTNFVINFCDGAIVWNSKIMKNSIVLQTLSNKIKFTCVKEK